MPIWIIVLVVIFTITSIVLGWLHSKQGHKEIKSNSNTHLYKESAFEFIENWIDDKKRHRYLEVMGKAVEYGDEKWIINDVVKNKSQGTRLILYSIKNKQEIFVPLAKMKNTTIFDTDEKIPRKHNRFLKSMIHKKFNDSGDFNVVVNYDFSTIELRNVKTNKKINIPLSLKNCGDDEMDKVYQEVLSMISEYYSNKSN